MGEKDNEEIIELTDAIEEEDVTQPPAEEGKDFPLEQAIDPKALEDEFDQLLQDSQEPIENPATNDDLDIESLFEEMEKDKKSEATAPVKAEDTAMTELAEAEIKPQKNLGDQDLPELDDLFNAIEEPDKPSAPEKIATEQQEPAPQEVTEQAPFVEESPTRDADSQPPETPAAEKQETDDVPDKAIRELEGRIIALESRSVEPDQETISALVSTFFTDNDKGHELLANITATVTKDVQKTALALVEEKLASMDVPSSEEIAAIVKEEIHTAVTENMPQPPDTEALIAEIKEDLQLKIQTETDAWDAERIALTQAVESTHKPQEEDLFEVKEQINKLKAESVTHKDIAELKSELDTTLSREIPAAAARIIREEIAALLKK